jgi:hypothetical protein
LTELHEQRQALSKFIIAAVTHSESVLDAMRRELKRVCPNVKIQNEQIQQVLMAEVLKREVVDSDKADKAQKKITRGLTGGPVRIRPQLNRHSCSCNLHRPCRLFLL